MLRLKRVGVVLGLSLAAVLASSVPTWAADGWGYAVCGQFPSPGCDLGAGKGGQGSGIQPGNGGVPAPGQGRGGGGPSGGGSGNGDTLGPATNLAQCQYMPSDYRPPTTAGPIAFLAPRSGGAPTVLPAVFSGQARPWAAPVAAGPAPGQPGAWYVYQCSTPGFLNGLFRPPVWIPTGPGAGGPSPAQLAQQAVNQLGLPSPRIQANPAGEQLVNVPTWLWMDRGGWVAVSATASVPGVSVTATARPMSVDWSLGDGATVRCTGPGTPFASGADPASASPDCGHTYRSSSAGQPNSAFPVTARVHWAITWSGAGQGGTFPDIVTTSTAAFRVGESQALNTGG